MNENPVIAALDLGSSKIMALAGELEPDGSMKIIASSECTSEGMAKGQMEHFERLVKPAAAVLNHIEEQLGFPLETVSLAITGSMLKGRRYKGVVPVSGNEGRVSPADCERVCLDAKSHTLEAGQVYVQHLRNEYALDGCQVVDPLGLEGTRLEVGYWGVHCDRNRLKDYLSVVSGGGILVNNLILSSVATGSIMLGAAEKQAGALVLDIGAGVTDYAVYRKGHVVITGVLPVGGDHFTNDLAMGLNFGRSRAEAIKRRHGTVVLDKDYRRERIWTSEDHSIGDMWFTRYAVAQIMNLRAKELFGVIRHQLGEWGNPELFPSGIYLTGGSSQIEGLPQLAMEVLGAPARLAVLPDWIGASLRKPEYATALGLLSLTAQNRGEPSSVMMSEKNILKKMARIFNLNL